MRGLLGEEGRQPGKKIGLDRGTRSGTQSLAQRPQQMAAEQQGCRETLRLHSGWLSGKKKVRTDRGKKDIKPASCLPSLTEVVQLLPH
ncbi:hypothetical protein ILYODFUR_010175 [Ilyodon furcidens]|uniref:Uncharacterized protein n=1 Tax=Ilyodon furcidens TaxID=33524 RepID=A0ABV0UU86_9TELE